MGSKVSALFAVIFLLLIQSKSYANTSGIDWSEYDQYYNYQEKSAGFAMLASILPVWSGSFHTGFNLTGLGYVGLKTGSLALIVYNEKIFGKNPSYFTSIYTWMVTLLFFTMNDMGHASDSAEKMNNKFSVEIQLRYDAYAWEQHVKNHAQNFDGVNIFISQRF